MPEYDPLYVAARSVLLDALEALGSQRDAVIVVGAQAVYLQVSDDVDAGPHTMDADLSFAPYTTDADLAVAPADLADAPLLEDLMRRADFILDEQQPGAWVKSVTVDGQAVKIPVDIMVPEGVAPPGGRRSVRLGPHDKMAARKALGLEGALIDNDEIEIFSLDDQDGRGFTVRVAGPAALVVAKLHKLHERLESGRQDRVADKDAADVYRIMQGVPVDAFIERIRPLLRDPRSEAPTRAGLAFLGELFGARASRGVQMAVEALRVAIPADRVEEICVSFTRQLRGRLAAD